MKLTIKNLLNEAYHLLEDEKDFFICTSIGSPHLLPEMDMLERLNINNMTIEYLHQNKPTKTLHKEFYKNKYFKEAYVWWNHNGLKELKESQQVKIIKEISKERLRFFKYIIDNFDELYKN